MSDENARIVAMLKHERFYQLGGWENGGFLLSVWAPNNGDSCGRRELLRDGDLTSLVTRFEALCLAYGPIYND